MIYFRPNWDGTHLIEKGDKLGDMTSELRPSGTMSEFVSVGPQNYAYRLLNRDGRKNFLCKVRGINLNYIESKLVNCYVIRDIIFRRKKGMNPPL